MHRAFEPENRTRNRSSAGSRSVLRLRPERTATRSQFVGAFHAISRAHWGHETERLQRRAARPACPGPGASAAKRAGGTHCPTLSSFAVGLSITAVLATAVT